MRLLTRWHEGYLHFEFLFPTRHLSFYLTSRRNEGTNYADSIASTHGSRVA